MNTPLEDTEHNTAENINAMLNGRVIQSVEPGNGREVGWIVINFVPVADDEGTRSFLTVWVGSDRPGLHPVHDWNAAMHYKAENGVQHVYPIRPI